MLGNCKTTCGSIMSYENVKLEMEQMRERRKFMQLLRSRNRGSVLESMVLDIEILFRV
jgi:hypothetical protein